MGGVDGISKGMFIITARSGNDPALIGESKMNLDKLANLLFVVLLSSPFVLLLVQYLENIGAL